MPQTKSPATLVAIAIAARKTGDRDLERDAIRELHHAHGVRISFCRDPSPSQHGDRA